MHKILYSNQAYIDLEEAISYISKESSRNAFEYLSRYENKIELLKLNPNMGNNCKNKNIKKSCKILVHESHIIVYKVIKSKKEIFIIRIFHASVNYKNKL
ncbi:type II toxin-antitoxin system RelE/ParE family toxin [Aliarcobacter skirrowii]|uniref:type II toxin-antitoxin system RelE/ParE family toxin n=1 Tax=Aliarcobacter skirrowii TaxID=28200 RepID=UPI0021B24FA5|nr:type II toxin-antitoxin system RelE/ParE family toxin [Aliarcobacter skirrowii]MCT7446739.1 type II toxin-antitoxin system RelE/ParE family toxin [Aliarcobacter skirrowii]MDX4036820.1 type II toxin-antitoxin system RelE/ParE family toxin [Aliarcobacter skirrowii]MDX4063808.1 type II toxin-antitoxin system RelE/ParE family toxin [Aliarcobacter skirrowii]